MTGSTSKAKNRQSKTAAKPAAETPVKMATAPKTNIAKTTAPKINIAKTTAPKAKAPAPAETPVAAKATRALPERKSAARSAPAAAALARPEANLTFTAEWTEELQGELAAGGTIAVTYALERALIHGGHGEANGQWGVHAYVQFLPGGEIVEAPVISFPTRFGKPTKAPKTVALKVDVPAQAQEVQVWFRNWTDADGARVLWDSRFGMNYRFAIPPAAAE